jgi:hypothetical protein
MSLRAGPLPIPLVTVNVISHALAIQRQCVVGLGDSAYLGRRLELWVS